MKGILKFESMTKYCQDERLRDSIRLSFVRFGALNIYVFCVRVIRLTKLPRKIVQGGEPMQVNNDFVPVQLLFAGY